MSKSGPSQFRITILPGKGASLTITKPTAANAVIAETAHSNAFVDNTLSEQINTEIMDLVDITNEFEKNDKNAPPIDRSIHARFNAKRLISQGELIKNVVLVGNKCLLEIDDKYNIPRFNASISQTFIVLHKTSPIFKAKFTRPVISDKEIILNLCDNHGFKNADEIKAFLIETSKRKPAIYSEKKNKEYTGRVDPNKIIRNIELRNDNEVHLNLVNNISTQQIKKLNAALRYKFCTNGEFQKYFEKPRESNKQSVLILKSNHAFKNNDEILKAILEYLNSCRIPTKQQIKMDLESGKLIDSIEFHKNTVEIKFLGEYNQPYNQYGINKFFFESHRDHKAFREVFEKPGNGKYKQVLTLKDGHHFKNSEEIKQFLMTFIQKSFSVSKEQTAQSFIPAFSAQQKMVDISKIKPPLLSSFSVTANVKFKI